MNSIKRVLASTKIKSSCMAKALAVADVTGTKKGTVLRCILENILDNCTFEELQELITEDKKVLKSKIKLTRS